MRAKERFIALFTQEEGGKRKLNRKLGLLLAPVLLGILGYSLVPKKPDTSYVEESSKRLSGKNQDNSDQEQDSQTETPKGITAFGEVETGYTRTPRGSGGGGGRIKYNAAQVIVRQGGDPDKSLPIGSSIIGRLLNGIDTREQNSFVRVLLPYGASFNQERKLERNSVLFGTATYPGTGEKVYVKFSRGLLPDGREFKLEAQALSSADFSPGLYGDLHGAAGMRVASTLGLTMVSGMSDIMVEKEVSGGMLPVANPKSTMKNAFYNGLAKASEQEAQRQAGKLGEEKDYVTVEAGSDVVISLTETFKGELK